MNTSAFPGQTLEPIPIATGGAEDDEFSLLQKIAQLLYNISENGGGGGGGGNAPIGSVIAYSGATAPTDWLLCFGQSLLRADYADLFTLIGTTFGAADGTHFNLPDLRGRTIAGKDNMGGVAAGLLTSTTMTPDGTTLGATGGAETHPLTTLELAQHDHALGGGSRGATDGSDFDTFEVGPAGLVSDTTGNSDPHLNVQPTLILNWIIKVTEGSSSGGSFSFGSGAPSGGSNGDTYLDTDSMAFYSKDSGSWAIRFYCAKAVSNTEVTFTTPSAGDKASILG